MYPKLCSTLAVISVFTLTSSLAFAAAPSAQSLSSSLKEDTVKKITLKGKADKGKKLSFTVTQAPQNGTIVGLNKSVVSYRPKANYFGTDSFQYTVTDSDGQTALAPATVTLNVQPVNDTPIPYPQELFVKKGATATIVLRASDIEGDSLSYQISGKPKAGNVLSKPVNNLVTYTPRKATYDKKGKLKKADFVGADSFSFKVKDSGRPSKSSKSTKVRLSVVDKCPTGKSFVKGVCSSLAAMPPVCEAGKVPKNDQCVVPATSCAEPEKLQNNICVTPSVDNVTLSLIKIGQGTITDASGAINCGDNCSNEFVPGAKVTLTVSAGPNYDFISWGGNCTGTVGPECSFELYANTVVTAKFAPRFNDTGITSCADSATNNQANCPQTAFPGQDGDYGRDKLYADDSNGHAGFNFTKLDASGNPTTAGQWNCVRDNVTKLVWEVKTADGGLHDFNKPYTWNDTASYIQSVNSAGWCGFTDWRLPTRAELLSIVNFGASSPAIDAAYFPNTNYFDWTWTSSTTANDANNAWIISFTNGDSDNTGTKTNLGTVRLVRSAQ